MEIARARLKAAMKEPGCALCRLRREAERRYFSQILFGQVNDGGLRLRLARSLGFCPKHTWDLLQADLASEPPALGFAILHAALAKLLCETLNDWLRGAGSAENAPTSERRARRHPLAEGIARLLAERDSSPVQERLMASLSPAAACPACESADASELVYVRALVRDLAPTDLGAAYDASGGLCLNHLQQALACAQDDETTMLLTRQAAASLARLVSDLEAYLDRLAQPGEPRPTTDPIMARAAAFFAGEGPDSG